MIMDGKSIKNKILDELKDNVNKLEIKPSFAVIQVGNNEASNVYVKQKQKMAEYVGYDCLYLKLDDDISEADLLKKIAELNNNKNIHGIMVQMPLPDHINSNVIQNAVLPIKDIDGLSDMNAGMLFHSKDSLYSCTPYGVMELLKRYEIEVTGKHAVIVGKSNLVGKPMAMMLANEDATVTLCHSKTKNLSKYTLDADILIVAVGIPRLITRDMVSEGSIVIDVGINRLEDGLCGDVDFDNVYDKVRYITPVPGGVGPMTVAILGMNVLKAYNMQISMNNDL